MKFSQPAFTSVPQIPEWVFAGTLTLTGLQIGGTTSDITGNRVTAHGWEMSRASLAGIWQVSLPGGALITLSLSCSEGVWQSRVLRAADWLPLASVAVNATGFSATESGAFVEGFLRPGNSLLIQQWGLSFQRLSDELPF